MAVWDEVPCCVDAHSYLVHTIAVTAANAHDITQATRLIHEDAEVVYGDSAYLGIQKRLEMAGNAHPSRMDYLVNRRPSPPHVSTERSTGKGIASISSPLCAAGMSMSSGSLNAKCQFGYKKTVYRGLRKNENRLYAMFVCVNLYVLAKAGRELFVAW